MKKKEEKEAALTVNTQKSLVLEGDPETQLAYATKAANALMNVVNKKPKKVIINGKQYLEYGDWQMLARFFGSTAGIEWTRKIEENGKLMGYEARAIVNHNGVVISSAEASCMKAERNWSSRDEFAIKSMAQTRAAAKALRNGFGWVAELAGYSSTPAEEMDGVAPMAPYQVKRRVPAADDEIGGAVIQTEPEQFLEPDEIKVVKEHNLKTANDSIKELLTKLGKEPENRKQASFDVKLLTGKFWKFGVNDKEIIEALQAKLEASDPVEALGSALKN